MEPLSAAIARLRLVRPSAAAHAPLEPEPLPECLICKDYGFVRHDVPLDHTDFGRAFPCVCRQVEGRAPGRPRTHRGPLATGPFDPSTRGAREPHPESTRQLLRNALEACRA